MTKKWFMSPQRVVLLVVVLLVPPAVLMTLAVLFGWVRPEWSFETVSAVLAGFGAWLGVVYAGAKLAEIAHRWQPEGARPPVSMAERADPEFVGREEYIERLCDALRPGRGPVVGLAGMGGVGKTELARVVAAKVGQRFADGVLWAECRGATVEAVAQSLAAGLGVADLPGDDARVRAAAWRSVASAREALVVLDDVTEEWEAERLVPGAGRCVVLVTTRAVGHEVLRGHEVLDIKVFARDEALALAERVLGVQQAQAQAKEAKRLFELVGYLPLGVSVALHLAVESGWSLACLTEDLERRGALAVMGREEQRRRSLWLVFEAAWEDLPAGLQEVLGLLPVFRHGASFDTAAVAAVMGRDEAVASERLHRLAGRSLVKKVGEGRWGLHPLVIEFARTRNGVDDHVWGRMAGYYVTVLRAANRLYLQGGDEVLAGLALFDLERGQIEAGQAWTAGRAGEEEEAARLCAEYPDAGVYVLSLRLHARELIRWLEAAAGSAGRVGDRAAEGRHLGNLGLAYKNLGETRRAIECHEQALAIEREIGDRRGEAAGLGSLGLAYAGLGETRRAIEFYEQALAIAREIGDRRGEGVHLGNLGLAHANLGETQRAIEFYEQALAIAREIGDKRNEGVWLGNLGLAYADLGETRRAIEFQEQALAIDREIGDRRGEGNRLGNLGLAYADLGETRRAIEFYEQALAIDREIGDRQGEGVDLGNLGLAYADLEETRRAILYHEQALAIAREIGDRRGEGADLGNLGLAYAGLGETRRAIEFLAGAAKIFEEIEDPNAERVRRWLAELEGTT